jgi:abortive infection bacteriophage resistance protein
MAIAMWLKSIRCLRNSCLRRNTLWDTMKTSGWIPKVKAGCYRKSSNGELTDCKRITRKRLFIVDCSVWHFGASQIRQLKIDSID